MSDPVGGREAEREAVDETMERPKPTTGERRTHVLAALVDGEFRVPAIAAWADVSEQQARADLRWLAREGFAVGERLSNNTAYVWIETAQGRQYIAGLSDQERDW
jgi:predicted ArsR family transcriptional regulator